MSEGTLRLGRVWGVKVAAHWSLVVVVWLISWSLATVQFPDEVPGLAQGIYWVAGVATAVIFFAGLLAHEVSHAVVARRAGIEVDGITLWLFGGVARLRGEASTPATELRVGIVGPVTSLAVAVLFGVLTLALDTAGAPDLVAAVAGWLARINLILAVFNLVPAFPLDGGRVLRGVLWQRSGDRLRATATAGQAGRVFGYTLIAVGLVDLAAGGSIGGVWFVFLGWFLLGASRAEVETTLIRAALTGLRASDIMSVDPITAPDNITLAALLDGYIVHSHYSTFPVVDGKGGLVGLVTMNRMKSVPADAWATTDVRAVARPLGDVPVVRSTDSAVDVLTTMSEAPDGRALVVDSGELVGIISPTDVARALELAGLREASRKVKSGSA